MSKTSIEVTGFKELQQKIKKLGDDKSKRKEVNRILGQIANPTLKAARNLAPVGDGFLTIKGRRYKRKLRQVGKNVYQNPYAGGIGKKSISKKVMTRAAVPMVTISPRSRKSADGFFLRQFVIPGTKNGMPKNFFMDQAYQQTKGQVLPDAERKMARYYQKQIDRLSTK